jgi:hypothetical protein
VIESDTSSLLRSADTKAFTYLLLLLLLLLLVLLRPTLVSSSILAGHVTPLDRLQALQLQSFTPRQQRWWRQQCELEARRRQQEHQQFEEAVRGDVGLLPDLRFSCQQQEEPQYGPHSTAEEEEEEEEEEEGCGEQECVSVGDGDSGSGGSGGCTVTTGAGSVGAGEQEVEQEVSAGSLKTWYGVEAAAAAAADADLRAAEELELEAPGTPMGL